MAVCLQNLRHRGNHWSLLDGLTFAPSTKIPLSQKLLKETYESAIIPANSASSEEADGHGLAGIIESDGPNSPSSALEGSLQVGCIELGHFGGTNKFISCSDL